LSFGFSWVWILVGIAFVSDFDIRISILLLMVHPRPASTIVLLRPGDDGGFEVLLTRRPAEMRFLGGYYVFPGGTVHQSDYSPSMLTRCRGLDGAEARRLLGGAQDPDVALGHWIAVVRELFEEVGVLLCVVESGAAIDLRDEAVRKRIELKRRAIVKKKSAFAAFLESENLFCDLSRAVYLDHWVTPEIYSMRFDTRFYIAALPAHQTSLASSEEVTHSVWIQPAAALAQIHRRDFPILPPTTTVLADLAQLQTWDRLRSVYDLT
jgi:8-oxo-dGTP pyrophosphatase MutT (NUDIX family)